MISFLKKNWIILLAILCGSVLLYNGVGLGKNYLESWALRKAKEIYEQKIATLDKRIKKANEDYQALSEKAGREREEYRTRAEQELRTTNYAFSVFKSDSAAMLRERNAKIEEILREKEKDEIVIIESSIALDNLRNTNKQILNDWAKSDKEKDAAHKKAIEELELKYTTCKRWTETLENRLKLTLWDKVKKYGIPVLAFTLGRLSK